MQELILKQRKEDILKKDGTITNITIFYVDLEINGVTIPYDLKLDYTNINFLTKVLDSQEK